MVSVNKAEETGKKFGIKSKSINEEFKKFQLKPFRITVSCLPSEFVEFRPLVKGSPIFSEPFATSGISLSALLPLQHSSSDRLTKDTHISCWIVARIGFGSSIVP
jgi:hypothetical protein